MRYFDFIKEIKEISTSHILVNEYGEGDIYEYLNNGEHKYPCIFLTVTNLTTTDSGTAINFTLFYTDRLVENQANKTSIQSTGISVIKQILSKYEQLHPEYLLSNVNYTPFTEKFTDMCAGVFCDVVIENQIDTLEDYDNECEEGAFTVKTITLTKNGVYDIVGYDSAVVLVETEDVKLESITITENGVYVPEEGGYNEVIVDVAGSNVKKLKVANIRVDDSCLELDKIGRPVWYGYNDIDKNYLTSFENSFRDCKSLEFLSVYNWDTSKITNMQGMFWGCEKLEYLEVDIWNLGNVTDMSGMFHGCKSLHYLRTELWDTSNVTNMSEMFFGCEKLELITNTAIGPGYPVYWNTSNVTNMSEMFFGCNILQSLVLSNFDTSKVKYMDYMFKNCIALQSLDLSNFDTSNVYNMSSMFSGCNSLQSLDLSSFYANKVINIEGIFDWCVELETLVGGKTIDEVISKNITVFKYLDLTLDTYHTKLDRASLRAIINGIEDLTGSEHKNLNIGTVLMDKLTTEDIAIATAKNWTIS